MCSRVGSRVPGKVFTEPFGADRLDLDALNRGQTSPQGISWPACASEGGEMVATTGPSRAGCSL